MESKKYSANPKKIGVEHKGGKSSWENREETGKWQVRTCCINNYVKCEQRRLLS